jgi:hypothetical protein
MPPLTGEEILHHLTLVKEQERAVFSFLGSGTVRITTARNDSSVDAFMAATRNPFRIKVELTHPWGRPVAHILFGPTTVRILSFSENRLYLGDPGEFHSLALLPVSLDLNALWSLLRGYPALRDHVEPRSYREKQITLVNGEHGVIQVIDFDETLKPRASTLPPEGIAFHYSEFRHVGEITYAAKTRVAEIGSENALAIRVNQMVFNRQITESIFSLHVPEGFELHTLDTFMRAD